MSPPDRLVRARHGATGLTGAVPPWDRIQYRLFHPALFTGSEQERQTGSLPPDTSLAPWPVAIVCNGINVGPEGYRWLAERLASAGIATLTYSLVGEITPGNVGLTPGLDLSAMHAENYGSRPSATAIGPILDALASEHAEGVLAGHLDLGRIVLGGHSAGGTVALLNARPEWFPGTRAAFSYAGHTMPATAFGHPEGTVLGLHESVPALVMGGTTDGVVAASSGRYGTDGPDHDPFGATFDASPVPGSALAVIEGAGHLEFCDPLDPSTARGFLETPRPVGGSTGAGERRDLIAALVTAFCAEHLGVPHDGPTLAELGRSEMIDRFRLR